MTACHTTPPGAGDCCLGIEIGGTKLQLVVGTAAGQIVERRRFPVDRDGGAAGIRAQIANALPELMQSRRPGAVGVGYGGPVDHRTGTIVKSYHVPGWNDFPLGAWLAEIAGVPVFVENDANVAALGEAIHGAGRGLNPVFYVTLGSGVGGGLVADDSIYHGFPPGEAEIGHLRLDRTGRTPEECCSGWSVDRSIRAAVAAAPDSPLAALVAAGPGPEARHLAPALAAGDPVARGVLDAAAENIALTLSHVVHLFHPEAIVIGGGLSLLGEPLRAAVAGQLTRFVMDAFQPGPLVTLAALREDAVPIGAVTLAARRLQES
jgi:glucokinase